MRHRLLVNRTPGDRSEAAPPDAGSPAAGSPLDYHRRLPGYAATPLRRLDAVAKRLGVAEVWAKDESERLGLPSYKILGASWAVYRTVTDDLGVDVGDWHDIDELRSRLAPLGPMELVAATDGNHGRAVARMARLLGWDACILVPAGTAAARIEGIGSEGASVEVVEGTYDEAVEQAAGYASERRLVISDTSWPGYERVPRWVIDGYSTVFGEIAGQLREDGTEAPTHVTIQMGVGALAAAAGAAYGTAHLTTLVGVEPLDAACVLASVAAGAAVDVPGPHDSAMAGLNCGRPSPLALPVVQESYAVLVAVGDEAAEEAMRLLATEGVAAGESARPASRGCSPWRTIRPAGWLSGSSPTPAC
jgi:diaminopropionate ammonia-lyase